MTAPGQAAERFDAIIVGARCAGPAAAIGLARAGRRVVALDRVRFPADTISTHLLWPGGVAELQALGALARVEALGAPALPRAFAGAGELAVRGGYTAVDGIAHALCVRRPGLDAALVATAREAGAQVREGARVTGLVFDDGRVAGVRCGVEELRAPLVIGADGRHSTVARRARERPLMLLRVLGGPARGVARDGGAVARGRRARHGVPL
jgi:flavin-dependent dehydrogenase